MHDLPTIERLRELLSYDPGTGITIWVQTGRRAGHECENKTGYRFRRIKVDRSRLSEARIIWALQTGEWPERRLDVEHRDLNALNNRWGNLRTATRTQNCGNVPARRRNRCGVKGVCLHREGGKWMARINFEGKCNHLGLFETKEAAGAAYKQAAERLFGEFARTA